MLSISSSSRLFSKWWAKQSAVIFAMLSMRVTPLKTRLASQKLLLLNQWPRFHGRLTQGAIDDDLISFRIWSGKGEDRLNEIPSILMKYNYILLINHLKINMSLLGKPRQNLSFCARPQYILSCSDFYKFSHLFPRVNNSVSLCCDESTKNDTGREAKKPTHFNQ